MSQGLKNLAVDVAGAAGVVAATVNQLHGVLRFLARDHRRIQTLLGHALQGDLEQRQTSWKQARAELLSHEQAEVEHVISVLRPSGKYEGLVARHQGDVGLLERRIQQVDAAEVGSETWDLALTELNRAVKNHVHEEEAELFHWIESDLGRAGVEAAAERFEAAKQHNPRGAHAIGPTDPDGPPIEPPGPQPPPAVPPGPPEPPMQPPGPTKPPIEAPGPTPPPAKV